MNFSVPHVAFDLEALAKAETGIITAISCIVFDFEKDKDLSYEELLNKTFYAKLNIADQVKRFKRTHDTETLTWWKTQPQKAQELSIKPAPNDVNIDIAFQAIRKYLTKNNYDKRNSYIWSRGNAYDFPKIQDIIREMNLSNNEYTKYYNDDTGKYEKDMINPFMIRDIRTFQDLIGNVNNGKFELPKHLEPSSFIEHHAQHDIAKDVFKMIHIYHN